MKDESSQTRPPYWLPAGLTLAFFAPGALLAAFWPRLTGFELTSRYGDAYAFWMYLAACQFTAGAQAACILIWEALVRLRPK